MSSSADIRPPKLPLIFLRWFCNRELLEDIEGDITEIFSRRYQRNKIGANFLFMIDVLLLFRPGIIKELEIIKAKIHYAMFKNYFKILVRNSLHYKGYALLNLFGLIMGIASAILILLWVNDEFNVNRFHANGEQIYQLFRNMKQSNGVISTNPYIPKPAGDLIKAEYPEVDQVATLSWPMDIQLQKGDLIQEEEGRFVTPSFLNMFSFELLIGDKSSVLTELNSIVISQTLAEKIFGQDWRESVGETLRIDDAHDAVISGVFRDVGDNSTIRFEWLLSAQAYYNQNDWVEDWGNGSFRTFVTIPEPEKVSIVDLRMRDIITEHTKDNANAGDEQLMLHKFTDTYLHSQFENGAVSGGRIDYVRILTVVAIFILLVACINFMNLATARSSRRSKEIGIRKVMGARRLAIKTQFYFEAFLFTSISVALSLLIVIILLPVFNNLVEKSLYIDFSSLNTWYFIIGIIGIVGILAGSYPAIILSRFGIIQSIKGGIRQSAFSLLFRKGLVILQFSISTLLIIGTAVIYKQIDYVLTKDLGLEKENLVAVEMEGDISSRLETYKSELSRIPEVKAVTASSGNPVNYGRSTSSANWTGKDPSAGYEVNVILSDEDFIQTTGMEILLGRDFSKEMADSTNFIINEVAAELMGFDNPLGNDLSFWGIKGKIIGVVKNFHMSDMYEPIAPLIITCMNPARTSVALIRIEGKTNEALMAIENVTKSLNPGHDFKYEFVDQAYAESYKNEETVSTLANIFAIVSVFISCLGLMGLASYSTEQRSREIGVRKVHGASIPQILSLISSDYAKLILVSFLLAIPFGIYTAQDWLNSFEFRTSLDPFMFASAGIVTFAVGILVVVAISYQAAIVNPVMSLRDE